MTDTLEYAVQVPETSSDRPREKLLSAGAPALDTSELVAVLLGTGLPGRPAEALARELLDAAGGLRPLARLTPFELASMTGVGDARAARILASIELGRRMLAEPLPRGALVRDGADVFRHFGASMRELRVEQFRVVLLDGKHRVLREELVSQGTLTSSPVHPREVFAPAVRHGAASVLLVHNHPSGDPAPSADDLAVTTRLVEAGRLIGIQVLDHVIVGDGAFTSFAGRGLLGR
jgi:DNA repair protein RadC